MDCELNVRNDNDSRFISFDSTVFACVCPRAGLAFVCDMAQCGDSWWPRLPSSDSGNHCISGIWLTAGDF